MAKLPDNNIGIIDARNALGHSSTDLGTLCESPNVNIFSWDKPKHYAGDVMPDSARNSLPGLIYDSVNKIIVYDKPRGGSGSPYRLGDFRGYDHAALPPTIDVNNQTVSYPSTGNSFDVGGTPYWGDPKYNWGTILGGFTFANMKIKVEVYDKDKVLRQTGSFVVSSLGVTNHWSISVSKIGISGKDPYIFIKGYFCDYDGTVLAPIPTNTDGFIRQPIDYKQMLFYYIGSVTTDAYGGQITSASLNDGDGGETSAGKLFFYNNSSSDYTGGRYYPKMVITLRNRSNGATTSSTQYDSPNNAPGPYMTRTFSWSHIEFPGGTANGSYDVSVVASIEYR